MKGQRDEYRVPSFLVPTFNKANYILSTKKLNSAFRLIEYKSIDQQCAINFFVHTDPTLLVNCMHKQRLGMRMLQGPYAHKIYTPLLLIPPQHKSLVYFLAQINTVARSSTYSAIYTYDTYDRLWLLILFEEPNIRGLSKLCADHRVYVFERESVTTGARKLKERLVRSNISVMYGYNTDALIEELSSPITLT